MLGSEVGAVDTPVGNAVATGAADGRSVGTDVTARPGWIDGRADGFIVAVATGEHVADVAGRVAMGAFALPDAARDGAAKVTIDATSAIDVAVTVAAMRVVMRWNLREEVDVAVDSRCFSDHLQILMIWRAGRESKPTLRKGKAKVW
jgi:hypothetical protein